MEKVSIIVPTYNKAEQLKRALDSILGQTYSNLEVIVINDGSLDHTKDILQEYQQKDERIVAIYQENSGVSVARNVGIKRATGTYINFVDGDDAIAPDIIEKLVKKIEEEKVDLVRYNCYYSTEENKEEAKGSMAGFANKRIESEDLEEVRKKLITGELPGYSCLLFMKSEILKNWNKGNVYDKKIRYMEDTLVYLELFCRIKSAYFFDEPAYYYYYTPETSLREKSFYQTYLKTLNLVYQKMKTILKKYGKLTQELSDLIDVKWLNTIVDHFALIEKVDPKTNKTERLRLIAELEYPKESVESKDLPLKSYNAKMIKMLQKGQYRKLFLFNKVRRIVTKVKH